MMKTPKQHMTDDARLTSDNCRSGSRPLTTPDDPDWDEIIPYELTDLGLAWLNHNSRSQDGDNGSNR